MSLVFAAGVALVACLSTLGLNRIHRSQATLLAALVIGAFLGPSVLGRVAPDLHDTLRAGGARETQRVRTDQSEGRARMWLENQRALSGSISEPARNHEETGDRVGPNRELVHWLMAGGCLVLMGIVCMRDRRASLADLPLGASLAIGCGGVGLLIARVAIDSDDPISSTVLAGSCAAASCTRWGLFGARRVWMNGAARVSAMTAITVIIVVLANRSGSWDSAVYLLAAPLLMSVLSTRDRPWLAATRERLAAYLPPVIVSISMVSIDLINNMQSLWIAALAWLTMSDLRAILGALILRSTGMNGLRAWMASLQLLGTGLMPVALTGYVLWMIGLPQQIACALFIAAAVAQIEGMTRSSAGRVLCSIRRMNQE